jgi:flagellar motor switch protein FliM
MSEILSGDRIAALVEAAKQGQLPEPSSPGGPGHRRGQRLRTVDFSRPTKFTSDHQRRIARAIDTFCQTAVVRLSSELRCPVELEAINTVQLTWSAAQAQLAHGALSAPLDVHPIGTRMLLTAEEPFVLMALECLLGGSPDRPPRERRLSEIDWVLTRRMFDAVVGQLSLVWQELGGVSLSLGEIDVHTDASQIASVSEPTFVVMIESRINKHSAALALLIPWLAIEPIAVEVAGRDQTDAEGESGEEREIARAMSSVPVTLRAEVASVDLAIEDILRLTPGSVIKLGAQADQGVSLYAENVKLGRAHPGSNGARRAVQISGTEGRPT